MYKKLYFFSGLQRSGSNLLASILCQNPNIYIEGKSPVLQLMWDAEQSCLGESNPFILANRKNDFIYKYISSIPKIYYDSCDRDILFDKNPYWIDKNNYHIITDYIDKNPKIIIFTRRTEEIISSMINIYKKNGMTLREEDFFSNDIFLINHVKSIALAKQNLRDNCLFVDYSEIVDNPKNTINKIYSFLGLEEFNHYFSNISLYKKEDDSIYKINGLHNVMPEIKKNNYSITLTKETVKRCTELNELIYQ